jgi:endogenous inhibitor of DNA gyrase (YacG/DUF329 family)
MPKCPKCGEKIDWLYEYDEAEVRFKLYVDSEGDPVWSDREFIDATGDLIEYACPECNQVVCDYEEEALAFLRGEEQ